MEFYKILQEMTEKSDVELSDICVMSVLVSYAQYTDEHIVTFSAREIQEKFKRLSLRTVQRSLQRLIKNGWIRIEARGQKNTYKVLLYIPPIEDKPIMQKKIQPSTSAPDPDVEKYKVLINRF